MHFHATRFVTFTLVELGAQSDPQKYQTSVSRGAAKGGFFPVQFFFPTAFSPTARVTSRIFHLIACPPRRVKAVDSVDSTTQARVRAHTHTHLRTRTPRAASLRAKPMQSSARTWLTGQCAFSSQLLTEQVLPDQALVFSPVLCNLRIVGQSPGRDIGNRPADPQTVMRPECGSGATRTWPCL